MTAFDDQNVRPMCQHSPELSRHDQSSRVVAANLMTDPHNGDARKLIPFLQRA